MARVPLVKKSIIQAGLNMEVAGALSAANADGYSVEGSGRVYLEIKNAGASPCVVTVETPGTVAGLAVDDQETTVPITTGHYKIGPWDTKAFNRPASGADAGKVYIDFSQVSSVTCALFGF